MWPTGSEYNGIIVGTVWTARLAARAGDDVREQLRLSVPLQTEGTGWDVGWAAVYLASEGPTGAFLPVMEASSRSPKCDRGLSQGDTCSAQ